MYNSDSIAGEIYFSRLCYFPDKGQFTMNVNWTVTLSNTDRCAGGKIGTSQEINWPYLGAMLVRSRLVRGEVA